MVVLQCVMLNMAGIAQGSTYKLSLVLPSVEIPFKYQDKNNVMMAISSIWMDVHHHVKSTRVGYVIQTSLISHYAEQCVETV